MKRKIDQFFGIKKNKSTLETEIFAGLAAFLATSYILTVNPNNILTGGTGDSLWTSVFVATALGACLGTLLMALLAKMPLIQAPGMGINALVGGLIGGGARLTYTLGNALFLTFVSGVLFLLFSVVKIGHTKTPIREKIFDSIHPSIRGAISVGIGLFIAFIGLKNAGIITPSEFTFVELVDFSNPELWSYGGQALRAIVAIFGILLITILVHYKIKGAVIIGILGATALAIPLGVADIDILLGKTPGISWNIFNSFTNFFSNDAGTFFLLFKEGLNFPTDALASSIMLVVSFSMIDMFDTMGTVLACTTSSGLVDKDGKPKNYGKIMLADSLATLTGSFLGTSTVTTMVESGAGVAEGGKTGLTAFVAAILFFLSIFLIPIFAFIPLEATAAALIYVGVLMMENVTKIDFKNLKYGVPSFLTMVLMPFTYSITNGIGIGIITYTIITIATYFIDKLKHREAHLDLNLITLIVTILFLVYFAFRAV